MKGRHGQSEWITKSMLWISLGFGAVYWIVDTLRYALTASSATDLPLQRLLATQGIEFPDIILQHHGALNGSGYPQRIAGDEILPEQRLITAADVVAAIGSYRPYPASLGIEKALDHIDKHRGILYDSWAVDACIALVQEKGYRMEI